MNRKPVLLLTLLAFFLSAQIPILAQSFEFEGIKYSVSSFSDGPGLVVKGLTTASYEGDLVIPSSIEFEGNAMEVVAIDDHAFYNYGLLTSVTIPNSVTSIGSSAFYGCGSLTSVVIGNSVISIGYSAFDGCRKLSSVVIPDSVTSIGHSAFYNCSALTSIVIGNSVTSIGEKAFGNCSALPSVVIPNSVTSIGKDAFSGCINLQKGAYPNTAENHFYNNDDKNIWISYPVETATIEGGWIWSCDKSIIYFAPLSLEGECIIPSTVTSIGWCAFKGCKGITSLNSLATNVPVIDARSFDPDNYNNALLTVPAGTLFNYCNDWCWNKFKNIHVEGEEGNAIRYNDDVFSYICSPYTKEAMLLKGNYSSMSNVSIPNRIAVENGDDASFYNVTEIGNDAFKGCSDINAVTFSKNLTKIGDNAFYGCSRLTSVDLPKTLTAIGASAFQKSGLKSIDLPETLASIGESAFQGLSFESVVIPASLKSVGDAAFRECEKLNSVNISENVNDLVIGNSAFKKTAICSITIPEGVVSIGNSAFHSTPIESIEIPDGVTSLGSSVFSGCSNLKSAKIGNGITEIPEGAFYSSGLSEIVFGSNVSVIGKSAFESAKALNNINLPSIITAIGASAFEYSGLIEVNVPASVDSIGTKAFRSCKSLASFTLADGSEPIELGSDLVVDSPIKKMHIGRDFNSDVFQYKGMTDLAIGNTVTKVCDNAFSGCSSLSKLQLGSSLDSIGAGAFKNCALSDVVVPPSVKSIGADAFASNSLKTLAIGYGITEIGEKAFDGNNSIENLYVTAVNPPAANNNTFSRYEMPLWLINQTAFDNYANFPRCWYRFEENMHTLVAVNKLSAEKLDVSGLPGETVKLEVKVEPADATLQQIFWRSTRPDLISVDNEGNVTFLVDPSEIENATRAGEGECQIIASTMYEDVPLLTFSASVGDSGVQLLPDADGDGYLGNGNRSNDIYTLQGVCVKRNATQADVDALAPGFYIIAGKKVIIK